MHSSPFFKIIINENNNILNSFAVRFFIYFFFFLQYIDFGGKNSYKGKYEK
jgi:hypothetical protein